jgi:hypothetical protein
MMNETPLLKNQLALILRAVEEYQIGPNCDWSDGDERKYNLAAAYEDIINKLENMIENA